MEKFKTLEIIRASPGSAVFHLRLKRPSSRNALFLDSLDHNPNALVVVCSGAGHHFYSNAGHHFYSGIDLAALDSSPPPGDRGRAREGLCRDIKSLQDAVTAIKRCRKPVIATVHGACVRGGVNVATVCDVRYCMEDAFFSVKEVDPAITCKLGYEWHMEFD